MARVTPRHTHLDTGVFMTTIAKGYAALGPTSALQPFTFERRAPREDDVAISIKYCGVCHSISTRRATNGAAPLPNGARP